MVNDSYSDKSKTDSIMELDQQVSQLIDRYEKLEKENELLYSEQAKLTSQVASLTETNNQVRVKIESLLGKLKMLGAENAGQESTEQESAEQESTGQETELAPENPDEGVLGQESFAAQDLEKQHE